jgi:MoaA/NifB/PqqE/SkfB family radical SAM enzyme
MNLSPPLEIDIKLGFACNQRCRHCAVAGKRATAPPTLAEVCSEIEFYRDQGAVRLILTGGEPTLRHDFVEIVRNAAGGGFRDVHLQTNAMELAGGSLASTLVQAGLTSAMVSLHGPSAAIHDKVVGCPGGFVRTVGGMRSLHEQGLPLLTNTVITRENVSHLAAMVKLVAREAPNLRTMCLSYPQITGGARMHFREVVPKVSETTNHVLEALAVADQHGIWCWVSDYPLCGLSEYEEHSAYVVRRKAMGTDPSRREGDCRISDYHELTDGRRVRPLPCGNCGLAAICPGLDKHYVEVYGSGELTPP